MIDTKARTIPKVEAIVGAEVEINGKRFWISSFEYHVGKGWDIRYSSNPPPEWLTR